MHRKTYFFGGGCPEDSFQKKKNVKRPKHCRFPLVASLRCLEKLLCSEHHRGAESSHKRSLTVCEPFFMFVLPFVHILAQPGLVWMCVLSLSWRLFPLKALLPPSNIWPRNLTNSSLHLASFSFDPLKFLVGTPNWVASLFFWNFKSLLKPWNY